MARKKKSDAEVAPLPEGVTITPGVIVMIEDLTVVPPIRAYGSSAEEARAAYDYQAELRARADAEDRGPVVAGGVKSALPPDEPSDDNSDLTPGRNAPADNPI